MGDFNKFLDELGKQPSPAEEVPKVVEEPKVEAPPDPFAQYIGHRQLDGEKSAFDAFLDEAITDEPEESEQEPNYQQHDWKSARQTLFGGDGDIWTCKRCCRQIHVQRTESVAQACARLNVNSDCAVQIVTDIHEA